MMLALAYTAKLVSLTCILLQNIIEEFVLIAHFTDLAIEQWPRRI